MALENAKKFISLIWEDEDLKERTANKGEEEVMAVAKEMGLDFTAEELKEAASAHNTQELTLGEMEPVAGGVTSNLIPGLIDPNACPKNRYRNHSWKKIKHVEDEWFSWIKEGGLFSFGTDVYECRYCGLTKNKST